MSIPPKVSISEMMGILKGKACDKTVQELPEDEAEAILGESFLGARLFCQHRWNRRRSNKEVREVPGRRGKAYRRATTSIRIFRAPYGGDIFIKATFSEGGFLLFFQPFIQFFSLEKTVKQSTNRESLKGGHDDHYDHTDHLDKWGGHNHHNFDTDHP